MKFGLKFLQKQKWKTVWYYDNYYQWHAIWSEDYTVGLVLVSGKKKKKNKKQQQQLLQNFLPTNVKHLKT